MGERIHGAGGMAGFFPSKVSLLVSESHSLSYALVMALASMPQEAFSRQEIDALCQLAYELHNKLAAVLAFLPGLETVPNR